MVEILDRLSAEVVDVPVGEALVEAQIVDGAGESPETGVTSTEDDVITKGLIAHWESHRASCLRGLELAEENLARLTGK